MLFMKIKIENTYITLLLLFIKSARVFLVNLKKEQRLIKDKDVTDIR